MNPPGKPLKVLALTVDPRSTIAQIRIATPLRGLAATGELTFRLLGYHLFRMADLLWADVLVVQRPTDRRHLRIMDMARRCGLPCAIDIDDLLTEPAQHLIDRGPLLAARPWIDKALDAADLIGASTQRLADALKAPGRQFELLPNAALPDTPSGSALLGDDGTACTTVLLAASDNVAGDAALTALARFQQQAPHALRVVAIGPMAAIARQHGLQVQALATMDRAEFLRTAASLRNAVAVIPIDDSRFSACKSSIKWFDFAAAGLPTLASALPPYADSMQDGRNGWLVPNETGAWLQVLREVAAPTPQAAQRRLAVAQQAQRDVLTHHGPAQALQAWRRLLGRLAGMRQAHPAGRLKRAGLRAKFALHDTGVTLRMWNRNRLSRRNALKLKAGA